MCVGVEDESSGMGITENTPALMTDGFCGSRDSPGRGVFFFPMTLQKKTFAADDSAESLCAFCSFFPIGLNVFI